MKKFLWLLIACLGLCGCNQSKTFEAKILEVYDINRLLVEGMGNETDEIYWIKFDDVDLKEYEKHDIVEITYDGNKTDKPIGTIERQ